MTGIHNLKRGQVIKALERLGWYVARDEGRHTVLKHPARPGTIPVPRHRQISSGVIREILKDLGTAWDEFSEVYW